MYEYYTVVFKNKKINKHEIMKNNKFQFYLQSNLNIFEKWQ